MIHHSVRVPRPSSRMRLLRGSVTLVLLLATLAGREAAGQGTVGGVYIDAEGMLRESSQQSKSEQLKRLKAASASAEISGFATNASGLRKVSLSRLEATVAALHAEGKPLTADLSHLAGLQEVRYLFFYPQQQDVVLAGPAECWKALPTGDVVGAKSGKPVLHLDDLCVALRYAFAQGRVDGFVGCSIEPGEDGVKRHAEFVSRIQTLDRSQAAALCRGMEQALGPQKIVIYGVPGSSRFALQMLAADYRLKRLALAFDPSPSKKVPSYLDLVAKSFNGGPQPQHRWWFVADYAAIHHSADRLAFELEGPALRVDTAPTADSFSQSGKEPAASPPARQFAELATRGLPELSKKIPVFAELENLVGLAVAAEIIRREWESAAAESVDPEMVSAWRPGPLLDNQTCPIAEFDTPKQTPSLANVRLVRDRHWLFSVSGGVEINPAALTDKKLKPSPSNDLEAEREGLALPEDGARWWWD